MSSDRDVYFSNHCIVLQEFLINLANTNTETP